VRSARCHVHLVGANHSVLDTQMEKAHHFLIPLALKREEVLHSEYVIYVPFEFKPMVDSWAEHAAALSLFLVFEHGVIQKIKYFLVVYLEERGVNSDFPLLSLGLNFLKEQPH